MLLILSVLDGWFSYTQMVNLNDFFIQAIIALGLDFEVVDQLSLISTLIIVFF